MLEELQDSPVSEARVQAMLKEMVRRAVAGMIARQESNTSVDSSEACLHKINSETDRIRDAQRAKEPGWFVGMMVEAQDIAQARMAD